MARQARSLDVLLAEVNAYAPRRNKQKDGGIGDDAHAGRTSDHNPNPAGVWRARDFQHDPAGGLDCDVLAAELVALLGVHPAMGSGAYVIWRGRIISTDRLSEGWRPSKGHHEHLHVSVATRAAGYDSTAPWGVLEDDMALDAQRDYEAFKQMQWRYDKFDSRPGAPEPDWTKGPTTFEHLSMILNEVRGIKGTDPKEIAQQVVALLPEDGADAVLDALADIIKERRA